MNSNFKLVSEPEVFNAPTFEYKDRSTYNSRLLNQKTQHYIVAEYFKYLGFSVSTFENETIGLLKHPEYGKIEIYFHFTEEPIGTFKKLLINRNGYKSSRQILYRIIFGKIMKHCMKVDLGKAA